MKQTQTELLNILACELFCADMPFPEITPEIRNEAISQAVYLFLHQKRDSTAYTILSNNARNLDDHQELHRIISSAGIPYVFLKGQASARYYPNPMLRSAGDVDFLVREEDFEKAKELLFSNGFSLEGNVGGGHEGFCSPSGSRYEIHRRVNGANEAVQKYMKTVFDDASVINGMMVPSDFHHCLILLCHSASHLVRDGIGLRHLCDWAVFANSVDVSQWETVLRDCGLWKFAKVMTSLSVQYLKMPHQAWCEEAKYVPLSELMEDIMEGGNFGSKDEDRIRQIKYISNRGSSTVDNKNVVSQLWNTIGKKAQSENKTRIGVIQDYFSMLLKGERKPDTLKTFNAAAARKKMYSELNLFETEIH